MRKVKSIICHIFLEHMTKPKNDSVPVEDSRLLWCYYLSIGI